MHNHLVKTIKKFFIKKKYIIADKPSQYIKFPFDNDNKCTIY